MASFIELIAKIKQKNNGTFKLVDAQDVECEDGKGLDEVLNEKLDKNQGIENVGKTMVVGADGNLVIGDSSPKNVYTKEEVDYLLDDKMDKPYVPIEITDNATITDALEGNFKIDKIKGNTYQKVETDILPTPSRPVPINSRKVKANGEYVELRSLKETGNFFDINFIKLWGNYSDGMTILDDGTVKITNKDAPLSPLKTKSITIPKSANYTIKYDFETISGGVNSGWISLVNMSNDNSKIFSTSGKTLYLDAGDYYVRFYRGQGATDVENNIVQYSNIVLVEGTSAPPTYIPPTVRDYKIVDHVNKTAKIVRNVKNIDLSSIGYQYQIGLDGKPYRIANYIYNLTSIPDSYKYIYANSEKVYSYNGFQSQMENGLCVSKHGIMRVVNGVTNKDELKTYVDNNRVDILYALATPTEETITYSADDDSEVGYSWQDTTSPSPDVPSDIEGVNEIDITVTGKNLFDINDEDVYLSPNITHNGNQIIKNDGSIFPRIKLKNLVIDKEYTLSYSTKLNKSISDGQLLSAISSKNMGYPDGVILYKVGDGGTDYNVEIKFTATQSEMYLIFSIQPETITNIQIELGDTATPYEPYQSQQILITPPQPLYSTVDGSIADEVDVEKGVYRYWLLKDKIENLATAVNIGQKHGNFQSYFITKVKDNSLKPITLLGNEDTRNLICNKCNVNLLDYNNEKEMFSLYVDKSAVFVGNINIERLNENTTLNIYNFIKDFEIVYPLETPIEIPIPEEDLAKLKSLKTSAGVNNIFVGGEIKPSIEARYPRDLALVQQQLEQKVLLMSETLTETRTKLLLQGGND